MNFHIKTNWMDKQSSCKSLFAKVGCRLLRWLFLFYFKRRLACCTWICSLHCNPVFESYKWSEKRVFLWIHLTAKKPHRELPTQPKARGWVGVQGRIVHIWLSGWRGSTVDSLAKCATCDLFWTVQKGKEQNSLSDKSEHVITQIKQRGWIKDLNSCKTFGA